MKYNKPALTFDQQAEMLIARGLIANKDELVKTLKTISYYRLSAYWFPFRDYPGESFYPGTTLSKILKRYHFDRKLRLLVLDAIEWIEINVRTKITYRFAHTYGPFGYTHHSNLSQLGLDDYNKMVKILRSETARSQETFVRHFMTKYGDRHPDLPLWMATEIMTFGTMLTFFRGINNNLKRRIASEYKIHYTVFESWLTSLQAIRNIAAHHSRLWNRELGYKPKIPKRRKHPEWHTPVEIRNNRIFGIVSIIKYLLDQLDGEVTGAQWKSELINLFSQFPTIPVKAMGFPSDWQYSPIWENNNR